MGLSLSPTFLDLSEFSFTVRVQFIIIIEECPKYDDGFHLKKKKKLPNESESHISLFINLTHQ